MTAKIYAFPCPTRVIEQQQQRRKASRAHLMAEAFAEQELAGEKFSFEKAKSRVKVWLEQMGEASV